MDVTEPRKRCEGCARRKETLKALGRSVVERMAELDDRVKAAEIIGCAALVVALLAWSAAGERQGGANR